MSEKPAGRWPLTPARWIAVKRPRSESAASMLTGSCQTAVAERDGTEPSTSSAPGRGSVKPTRKGWVPWLTAVMPTARAMRVIASGGGGAQDAHAAVDDALLQDDRTLDGNHVLLRLRQA